MVLWYKSYKFVPSRGVAVALSVWHLAYSMDSRRIVFRYQSGATDFSVFQDVPTGYEARQVPYSMDNQGLFLRGRGLKLVAQHLVPKIITSGAVPPFPHLPSWRGQGQL